VAGYEPIDLSGLRNASLERLSGRPPAVGEQMFRLAGPRAPAVVAPIRERRPFLEGRKRVRERLDGAQSAAEGSDR
jgi:hypothetical protein